MALRQRIEGCVPTGDCATAPLVVGATADRLTVPPRIDSDSSFAARLGSPLDTVRRSSQAESP
jgi:hypothetical protein